MKTSAWTAARIALALASWSISAQAGFAEDTEAAIRPKAVGGRVLNLDFETGSLENWTVEGEAFAGQPIRGDTVSSRRSDMRSAHEGDFWIGGYEKLLDQPLGTMTSEPFVATSRFASFLVGGGNSYQTRVELWAVEESKPFYVISGRDSETMSQVVVDIQRVVGKQMYIRLVDESDGHWGHINFDNFRLHRKAPGSFTPPTVPLAIDEYPHSGLSAEAAAAAMKVPDGFRVSVCASEPDVQQPIAMCLDDRGRTWIAEAYEYPQRAKGEVGRDRILVFEDTNGDGRFDSRKVFAEGLNLVSGLEVGFGGVWVGAAPYLMFIPDSDGNDVADGPPQVLLDGWGFQDTHETLNAFCWGPDGWLYGCHGVFTHSNVGKPGTPDEQRVKLNAGVWRYHPLRHAFEVFAHGTSNPWGVDFNEHGESFVTACVIPHLFHMIPGARYHRQAGQHFNPYTYDDIKTIADHLHYLGSTPHSGNGKSDEAGGGHAHCGAMFYYGGAWPDEYRGALMMNNIHGQRLNTDLLEPKASGYVAHHGNDFLLTGDMASQIINMRYGPDGQVTFIDWYDMQACHSRQIDAHDRTNGRIYKISYGKTAQGSKVDLAKLSDLQLVEMCLHQNEWYVRHSRRLLQERSASRDLDPQSIERLTTIATTHPEDTARLRAMWACHVIGKLDGIFQACLSDSSAHVRGWAWRLVLDSQQGNLDATQIQQLSTMALEDSSPIVRRSIASVADQLALAVRWPVVEALLSHGEDADDHNLPLMYWYILEPLAGSDPDRALALAMAAGTRFPKLREFTLRRIGGAGESEAIARLMIGLQRADSIELQLTFLHAMRSALIGQRNANSPEDWSELYQSLRSSSSAQVQLQAAALGAIFSASDAIEQLLAGVKDRELESSWRIDAVQALMDAGRGPLLLDHLLQLCADAEEPGAIRQAAIRALASVDDAKVPERLIEVYPALAPAERSAAMATLCSRAAGVRGLLVAMERGLVDRKDLSADLARQIEYLDDAELIAQLEKVWGKVRKSSAEKASQIEQLKQLVARTDLPAADIKLGREMFSKTCQRCHILYGVGEKIGPDLTGSNRSNLDYLLENIVDPSAVMANEYRQSIFMMEDGQVVTGIVRSETANAVTVQTADAPVVLPTAEISARKTSDNSMMPENQLLQFNEREIRSLLGYLRGSVQVELSATNQPGQNKSAAPGESQK